MRTDKTQLLEKYNGQCIKVRFNIADDSSKFSFIISAKLRIYKTSFYEIVKSGDTWIHFTDENILKIWDEETPIIELK